LVYGDDWEREDYDQIGTFGALDARTTISGAYAQLLAQPSDALDISAALRYDRHSDFGGFMTGRVSFAYQATEALTLRGQIARGFRAPSNFELNAAVFGNPDLEAETSLSAELGADYALANGGRISATTFEIRVNNKILYDNTTFRYEQIEASRSRGLELEAAVPVMERLNLNLAYTYTEAVVTEGPNTGDRLANVPRHHLSLGLDALLADRLRGSTTLTQVAGRTSGLASYTTVDLGLRYELTDRADLTLRVTNLFDRNYQEIVGYKTSDRAFYLGVASRF
jgi:vitamin B12 transporter